MKPVLFIPGSTTGDSVNKIVLRFTLKLFHRSVNAGNCGFFLIQDISHSVEANVG